MEWYLKVLKQYADFRNRARRKEFWMFFLFNFVVAFVLGALSMIPVIGAVFRILSYVYSLAVFIPQLAVGVRRLHDIGKSGWWLVIMYGALIVATFIMALLVGGLAAVGSAGGSVIAVILMILVGLAWFVWYIVWMVTDSQPGENKWGPNPKEASLTDAFDKL